MWRLGGGTAALGLGVFLTTGPIGDGIAGFVGVLFCISAWLAGRLNPEETPIEVKSRIPVNAQLEEGAVQNLADC